MPGTRRTPIRRQHTSSIAAALPLYQRARKARAKANHSNSDADRQAAHAAERDCDRLLGIRLWHVSIFDFDDIFGRKAPPAYMGSGEDWHRALELRQQLVLVLDRQGVIDDGNADRANHADCRIRSSRKFT